MLKSKGPTIRQGKVVFLAILIIATFSILGASCFFNLVYAQESLVEVAKNLDLIWIIAASAMVFFMQVGFTALETGFSQAKNAIDIALKNITVFILCAVFYFLCGFALMFGKTEWGLVGISHFLFNGVSDVPLGFAFVFFQVVFAGTAATILTGAMTERTRTSSVIWATILIVTVIYPIFGHWTWGGYFHHEQTGWLARMGFVDFAGSTVVHSIGGWFALAGAITVGPRIGKYNKDGTANPMGRHNIPLATLGTLFLWFGWFGFNGGSTLKATANVGLTIVNTNIAAGAAGAVALLFGWLRAGRFDAGAVLVGVLGGLVAVTAGSNRLEPWGALVVGLLAGVLVLLGETFIEKILRVDDPVGAVTCHGIGGVVGTVAVALFAPSWTLPHNDRLLQLGIQFLGITVAFAWSFGIGLLFFWGVNKITRIRVGPEEEARGLNVAEYGDVASWLDFARISKLQDLNVLLEKKIQERTAQLSTAKKYTDSIVKSMREALVVTDTTWIIREINPTIETLLGYRREELLGKSVGLLVRKEEDLFKDYSLRKLLDGEGIIHDYSTNFLTKNREEVPVLFTGAVMKDDLGRPLGMVGIARDMRETLKLIRELQKINEAFATFNEKLQTIMKSVSMPLVTLDLKRKILSVNPAFETLTGWRTEEIYDKQYDTLLSLALLLKGISVTESGSIGKAVIFGKGGNKIDVHYTEALLKDFRGNDIGFVCTLEDISREAEIDRMKTEFISTVSHELRTPLTSIKGYVDLILEGDTGEINDTQKEFLQIVAQSSDRLAMLVNDLLDVERIESGRIVMKQEPVDIALTVYGALRTFSNEIEKKGLHLLVAIQEPMPMILGDRERIEQVLANLISNAIKYNRADGCIKVSARPEDAFIRVEVMDSGIGIGEEHQRRLFEKFFRADTSLGREVGGTGLGLSIVKSIVEKLGGRIEVKSKLGEGSTFTILLPAGKVAVESPKKLAIFE